MGARVLLIDGDPWGGGLELALAAEEEPGLRWPDLAEALPVRIATSRSPRRSIGETAGRLAREAVTADTSSLQKVFSFVPEITGVPHLQ